MFRSVGVSIVLVLAASQNARLLCDVFCERPRAVTHTCHEQTAATGRTSLAEGAPCHAPLKSAFLVEGVRRGLGSSREHDAIQVNGTGPGIAMIEARIHREADRLRPLLKRPLERILRI